MTTSGFFVERARRFGGRLNLDGGGRERVALDLRLLTWPDFSGMFGHESIWHSST
jgi:hypothetical protein